MTRCRCGHTDDDHRPHAGIFPTQRSTIAGGNACRRCDCSHFHPTTYSKTHLKMLRAAAREMRGQPLQPRLFEGGHR